MAEQRRQARSNLESEHGPCEYCCTGAWYCICNVLPILITFAVAPHCLIFKIMCKPQNRVGLEEWILEYGSKAYFYWNFMLFSIGQTMCDVLFLFLSLVFFWRFIPVFEDYLKAWNSSIMFLESFIVLLKTFGAVLMDIFGLAFLICLVPISLLFFWRLEESYRIILQYSAVEFSLQPALKIAETTYLAFLHWLQGAYELLSFFLSPFLLLSPLRLNIFLAMVSDFKKVYFGVFAVELVVQMFIDLLCLPVLIFGIITSPFKFFEECYRDESFLEKALMSALRQEIAEKLPRKG
jgi:hypothetical protein